MRELFLTLILCGFALTSAAQTGPVVTNASFLEWDHEAASATITDEYRIYLSRTAGVAPDGTPDATVAAPNLEWAISGIQPGQWHAVVTAYDVEADVESGPSGEISFFVLEGPSNFSVRVP